MDKEYLQNMIGSPYMEEGLGQALSKGISGIGKFLNRTISPQIQTPTQPPTPKGVNSDPVVKNDLAFIINKTIDIIIRTVKSDVAHAGPFLSDDPTKQKPLPQSWEEPSLTKEANAPPSPQQPTGAEEDEIEGEFLYNFSSRYRKIHTFSIEVGHEKVKLPSGKEVDLRVIWRNHDLKNLIYIQTKKGNEPVSQTLLFKFYDDQVNPRNDAGKKFSVISILKQAQPNREDLLDPSVINPQILQSIRSKNENLLRALYATTTRKAMEFKSKKKDSLTLTADDEGNIQQYVKGQPYGPVLTKDDIKTNLYGPDSQKWHDALEHINYFKDHPEMKPAQDESYKEYNDAILALLALGYNKTESGELAKNAWKELISTGKSPDRISSDDITHKAVKGSNKTPATTPSPTTPVSSPTTFVKVPPETSSPHDYNPFPEPAKVSSPVSKEPEPAKVSSEPTAPVSNAGKVEKKKKKDLPIGTVRLDGDTVHWENPKTGQELNLTKKQAFYFMKKSSNFVKSLIASGIYDKIENIGTSPKNERILKETYTKHGNFNPWNKSNFLP